MIGNSAKAQQMLSRTGNHSTKPSARGYSPLNWGVDVPDTLTPEEQREVLKRRIAYLQSLLDSGVKNKAIGVEIYQLCNRMSLLRKKTKKLDQTTLGYQFMQAAFHLLDEKTYKRIFDLSVKRTHELHQQAMAKKEGQ